MRYLVEGEQGAGGVGMGLASHQARRVFTCDEYGVKSMEPCTFPFKLLQRLAHFIAASCPAATGSQR